MEAKYILELMRAQRHDFINYLQVILGYLQLNKVEEAKLYAAKVVLELTRFSKITHLCFPEVALVFITAQNEAAQKSLDIAYNIQTDLRSCALTGQEISLCLEKALNQIIVYLSPPQASNRRFEINFQEESKRLSCNFTFSLHGQTEGLEKRVEAINSYLYDLKGRASLQKDNGQGRITIYFPMK